MSVIEDIHADHGATFRSVGDRRVVEDYGRPERTHRAVRNGVGVCEMGYGVVEVTGEDRVDFVNNAVSNRVRGEDGTGVYALLLDPQGRITTDLYVYTTEDRLLVFCPPDRADPLATQWRENTFIQDVTVRVATDDFGVFGVHGPYATEKIASVLNHAGAPEPALTFVRGSMGDAGVTVVATDGLTGEDGYEVICAADAAPEVFETLVVRGNNAAPFGYRTWETLTLEAGTPLFDTELVGRIPNVAGVRNALDFEKGCYVGQEVVSKVENVGQPSKRVVGLTPETVPEAGDPVFAGEEQVGEVTRAVEGPSYEAPVALAYVEFDAANDVTAVGVRGDEDDAATPDGEEATAPAETVDLPFVEGSLRSARLPTYPTE